MGIRTPADLRDRSRTVTQDAAQSTRLTPLGASPERGTRQRGINYLIRDVGVPGFSIDRPVSVPRLVHFSPPTNTRALRLLGCGAGNRLLRVLLICACRRQFLVVAKRSAEGGAHGVGGSRIPQRPYDRLQANLRSHNASNHPERGEDSRGEGQKARQAQEAYQGEETC